MSTYRKFDRFRAHSAFATNENDFNTTAELGLFTATGTGTPALTAGAAGGASLATSAAANDSAVIQRGNGSAKLADIELRKHKKFSVVARVEAADFANIEVNFGLGPAAANPFTGSASVYMSLKADGTYSVHAAGESVTGELSLITERDEWGGVDLELYWDGADHIGFFVNGKRVGGFRVEFAETNLVLNLPNPLAVSVGTISRTATAKTVLVRRIASAVQVVPDQRGLAS